MTYDHNDARRDSRRALTGYRRRRYERKCREAGMQPMSRERITQWSLIAATTIVPLATVAHA